MTAHMLPLGTAEQYRAQRVLIHGIAADDHQRVSLKQVMTGFHDNPVKRPPLDPMPHEAYKELRAIAGLVLERAIWPELKLWNEQNGFPYAYRTDRPDKLNCVERLSDIPVPISKRQPLRRDWMVDRGFVSMYDIIDFHVRSWDKRVHQRTSSTREGALDVNFETRMRARFQEVSQKPFRYGTVKPKEIQRLNQFIIKNAEVGVMIVWSLIDLIPALYQIHFGGSYDAQKVSELVDSSIDDLCIDLASLPVNVIQGIECYSFETIVGPRVSILPRPSGVELARHHFDPKDFKLYETPQGPMMHFAPEHLKRMSVDIPAKIRREIISRNLPHTMCPALIAQADSHQSIIQYILAWAKRWVKQALTTPQ